MQFFVPQCHIVKEQAALKENIEIVQVQQKEMQLVQLYKYATHHHSHHHNNYILAQKLIKELICHFRDQKMYRFLIELVQKLITKADIIQYSNINIIPLNPHLANQIATLEYAATYIHNFPELIQLRDIIRGYFSTSFLTPPFIVNQYLLDLFNEQFIKDIYLTQFNQIHQIQLINYGHPYTPNYSGFTFYLYDDDAYSQVQPQVNTTVITSQYTYQQPSQITYQYPTNQQLNMTDSQYQKYQSQQNTYQQQQQQPQQSQQITYNNYSNQNIYVQPQNPYQSVPQPQILGYGNNNQNQASPYSSAPQKSVVGYQQTSTYNQYNYSTDQTQQYQAVPPQSAVNQGQPNYQPQPPGYQNSTQPPGYQNPSSIPGYQNPSSIPGYQNPSSIPGYQDPSQIPGYQNIAQAPGYQNNSQAPGYQNSSQAPGYQNNSQAPGYQNTSQAPGYQNTSQTPGYQNSSQTPGYQNTSQTPGYQDPSQTTGYQNIPQAPGYQNSSQPTHPNQIASFPPTQGYQYSLQNNQDYQSQQNQVYPNQIPTSNPTQNFNNDPKQPVEQQNNYNTNPNQQYNPQNQQPPPYSYGQAQSYEQKQLATSQTSQNVAQAPDQPKEQSQINVDQNQQNIQAQLVNQNSNIQYSMPDLKQANSIYSHPIPDNSQLEYQNPSYQASGNPQMAPPPPPPPPPPPKQQPYQEFLNQNNINEQNPVSQQGSLNLQNSIQNNQPAQDDKSLLEALFLNQSLKNLQLIDNRGVPLIDQKVQFRQDRDIKGFKNHDEHALYILKCYVEGKYAQNKIDRTAEMKNLVSF